MKSLKEVLADMDADKRKARLAEAAAAGLTPADLDAAELAAHDAAWKEIRAREAALDKAYKAREMEKAGKGLPGPARTFTGPLTLESVTGYKCEACGEASEDTQDARLYQCPECEGYFNEGAGAGDKGNKCPECEKRGKLVDKHSCTECDKGPLEKFDAFKCPADNGECGLFEDWTEINAHLMEAHAGEVPEEWLADVD